MCHLAWRSTEFFRKKSFVKIEFLVGLLWPDFGGRISVILIVGHGPITDLYIPTVVPYNNNVRWGSSRPDNAGWWMCEVP